MSKTKSQSELTHFNARGEAHMVDVGGKASSQRVAVASGRIHMQADTLQLIQQGGHKKGDVLAVSRLAGIMAAKKTADLIPLCHPIPLTHLDIEFQIDEPNCAIECIATAKTNGVTGVEMEALAAVQIALLTIYDMCKAVDRGMEMQAIHLHSKSGGKSGDWRRE